MIEAAQCLAAPGGGKITGHGLDRRRGSGIGSAVASGTGIDAGTAAGTDSGVMTPTGFAGGALVTGLGEDRGALAHAAKTIAQKRSRILLECRRIRRG